MLGIRHAKRKGTPMHTKYGLLLLDGEGRLEAAPEGVTREQILTLPNFLDEELFPLPNQTENAPQIAEDAPEEVKEAALVMPEFLGDVKLQAYLLTLAEEPKNLNSEGKLDMGKMNAALRSKGFKSITAAKRDTLMG